MAHGVILDIDGTLLLSNDAHARSWVEAYRDYGYEVSVDTIHPLIGMGADRLMARITPGLSEDEGIGKQIAERRKEVLLQRYAPNLKPAPGARALVQRMKDDGLQLGVASSAKGDELKVLLNKADIADLVDATTSSSEASESKPAPDVVQAALEKLGLPPSQMFMLGDTPYDIESAGRAHIRTIAFRCGGHSDSELKDAVGIYDDPRDLLEQYDTSPLSEDDE